MNFKFKIFFFVLLSKPIFMCAARIHGTLTFTNGKPVTFYVAWDNYSYTLNQGVVSSALQIGIDFDQIQLKDITFATFQESQKESEKIGQITIHSDTGIREQLLLPTEISVNDFKPVLNALNYLSRENEEIEFDVSDSGTDQEQKIYRSIKSLVETKFPGIKIINLWQQLLYKIRSIKHQHWIGMGAIVLVF
jgi:hypothetical protein